MSYIRALDDFWRLRQKERVTSNEADLYFYLLHRCNQGGWVNPFDVSTQEIEQDLNMSRPTIVKTRMSLQKYGLVDFHKGKTKGKPPTYFLRNLKKKPVDCVKEINTIDEDCVNVANTIGVDCVKEINTIKKEKKESFPPHTPLYKEKKEKNNLASLGSRAPCAHARERVVMRLEGNAINSTEYLRILFLSRMVSERMMMMLRIHDRQEYLSLCDEILMEWEIAKGTDFAINSDVKQHFINLLRKKNEKRKSGAGGARPSRDERRTELIQSAYDSVCQVMRQQDYVFDDEKETDVAQII